MTGLRQDRNAAREIAAAALGRDPGPMAAVESSSHHVYAGSDVVVKIIDAAGHSWLDRETALAPRLPAGLTAPFPGGGLCRLATREVRYARVPGAAPGMGMPGVDGVTARLLAADAVQRLGGLHSWMPAGRAEQTLREPLDHGGFISHAALCAGIENLAAFRGRQNAKLQYAVLAAAALHGGTEPDLLDEVAWLQADDFWQYALFAAVA